jgi:hypothetical protein
MTRRQIIEKTGISKGYLAQVLRAKPPQPQSKTSL